MIVFPEFNITESSKQYSTSFNVESFIQSTLPIDYSSLLNKLNMYNILVEAMHFTPLMDESVKTPNLIELLRFIHSNKIDYSKLVNEVNNVVNFISKSYSDFEATLDVVQDVEVPDWKDVVLTIYLRASVEDILELWDSLYEEVEVENIVISILPASSHE